MPEQVTATNRATRNDRWIVLTWPPEDRSKLADAWEDEVPSRIWSVRLLKPVGHTYDQLIANARARTDADARGLEIVLTVDGRRLESQADYDELIEPITSSPEATIHSSYLPGHPRPKTPPIPWIETALLEIARKAGDKAHPAHKALLRRHEEREAIKRGEPPPKRPKTPPITAAYIELSDSDDEPAPVPIAAHIDLSDDSDDDLIIQEPRRAANIASWQLPTLPPDLRSKKASPVDLNEYWATQRAPPADGKTSKLAKAAIFPVHRDSIVASVECKAGEPIVVLDQLVVAALGRRDRNAPFHLALASDFVTSNLSSCRYLGRYQVVHHLPLTWTEFTALSDTSKSSVTGQISNQQHPSQRFKDVPSLLRVPAAASRTVDGRRWLQTWCGGFTQDARLVEWTHLRLFATAEGAAEAIEHGYVDKLSFAVLKCVEFDHADLKATITKPAAPTTPSGRRERTLSQRLSLNLTADDSADL